MAGTLTNYTSDMSTQPQLARCTRYLIDFRSSLREDVEPRVQDLSIDKRAQEPRHSSRNGHYPSNYVTDGHEDPYEDPQRARQSHRGRREGRDGYDEGAGSKHRRGSRGDEPAQYGARDTGYRDSRTDRRSREEEDDRRDDGSRSRKDRHAAREEEEGYDDRGRGHRDKDGYEEGREYARREHRSSRRDRSHRDDDRGHDRYTMCRSEGYQYSKAAPEMFFRCHIACVVCISRQGLPTRCAACCPDVQLYSC